MRLIDADELACKFVSLLDDDRDYIETADAIDLIEESASVDAVPVVRCKDCEYWVDYDTCHTGSEKCNNKYCASLNISTNERFYCVYGERKTDGNDDN